ncbi:MAG: FAD-dependent oxidoreductase, partial [Myxococcales bacterium]|nr:FAD-dependent oxidoreductase [Myxococcales bacterium]
MDVRPKRIVVVGNGMVSHRLCKELVRRGLQDICVLGEESYPAYDRIRLSQGLGQGIDDLLLSPADWYRDQDIDLRLGVRVVSIDRAAKTVLLAGGERIAYGTLILATGSTPAMPLGLDLPSDPELRLRVSVFRNYSDLVRLSAVAGAGKRFAIVGGGLLGLETAKVLRDQGCQIHLLESGNYLMSRQLDPGGAEVVRKHLEGLGIRVHLRHVGQAVRTALRDAGEPTSLRLEFKGGIAPLSIDHVVIAAGIRPRDELARDAGLKVAARGGIVVDDVLRTSDPDIHALGECASHRGVCYGLVAPGYSMAATLADSLSGKQARFQGSDLSCQLKLLGLPVTAIGAYDQEAELVSKVVPGGRRTLMLDGRRVMGATAVGPWAQLPRLHDMIKRGSAISQSQLRRFRKSGDVFGGSDLAAIQSWPAGAVVCNCAGVTRGQLSECVALGHSDVADLGEQTGAGQVCGSCKPLLGQLVGEPVRDVSVFMRTAVLAISALALMLGSAYMFLEPLEFAHSVQAARRGIDRLWRDDTIKQWTGYGLVAVSALGLLLSARKRLRWFS